ASITATPKTRTSGKNCRQRGTSCSSSSGSTPSGLSRVTLATISASHQNGDENNAADESKDHRNRHLKRCADRATYKVAYGHERDPTKTDPRQVASHVIATDHCHGIWHHK